MQPRGRLIAAAVFLVLAVVLIVIVVKVPFGGEAEPTPEPAEPLFPDSQNDVAVAIEVADSETGETLAASSEDGQTWAIDQAPQGTDLSLPVDSARLTGVLIALPGVTPTRVLSEVEALAPYGLDSARYTVRFTTAGGRQHTLYVGALNPTGTDYYVRLTEDVGAAGVVYLVPSYNLEQVLGLLSDPPVLAPTPTLEPPETEG